MSTTKAESPKPSRWTSHEDYLAALPPEHRGRVEVLRQEVESRVPRTQRCISYNIPALKLASLGQVFFYAASFKNHVGMYPPLSNDAALMAETEPYRGPKGNLIFPHAQPLPLELIGRVAVALAAQCVELQAHKRKKKR